MMCMADSVLTGIVTNQSELIRGMNNACVVQPRCYQDSVKLDLH